MMIRKAKALDPGAPVSPEVARQVEEIMQRPYRKIISGNAEEGFLIEVPDLPGCMTAGETEAEALEMIHDAMALWLTVAVEDGLPIPPPSSPPEYSGRLLVRMPKTLHRRLIERAEDEGVSANQLAVALLAKGL
jgi:antitoxin HicB